MECARIKGRLSEYIDGTLDAKTRISVEDHVSICSDCKAELASLSALVEELGALETVKAPADFLEKIHEKMEPRADFYRILRKLFVPFHIKIPLELAAAATMVFLVISVLNVQQVAKQVTQIPDVATFERYDRKSEVGHEAPAFRESLKKSAPLFDQTIVSPSAPEPVVLARKGLATPVHPDFAREPEAIKEAVSKPPVWTGQSIELALLLKTEVPGRGSEREAAMEAAPSVEGDLAADEEEKIDIAAFKKKTMKQRAGTVSGIKREDLKEENRSLLPQTLRGSALKDDLKPSLAYSYREDSVSRVKHLIQSLGGRILSVKNETQKKRPQSIDGEIPFEHYELFCEKLGRLGTFRSPPPGLTDKDQETVRVQINLISSE
jgi:hypothetical protein